MERKRGRSLGDNPPRDVFRQPTLYLCCMYVRVRVCVSIYIYIYICWM